MKPYNERLPLIDEAIEKGEHPTKGLLIMIFNEFVDVKMDSGLTALKLAVLVGTRQEFEQRVKERNSMKEYEYMKEYECNGEKPDLADDVLVDVFFTVSPIGWAKHRAGNVVWESVSRFQISDERWKPENKNDWYEKGELPPVGAECEFKRYPEQKDSRWDKCEVLGYAKNYAWLLYDGIPNSWGLSTLEFRSLRTERDELIEKVDNMMNSSRQRKAIAEQIVDELILTESKDDS